MQSCHRVLRISSSLLMILLFSMMLLQKYKLHYSKLFHYCFFLSCHKWRISNNNNNFYIKNMVIERRRETNHYHSFHLTSSIHNLLSIILLSSQLTSTINLKKKFSIHILFNCTYIIILYYLNTLFYLNLKKNTLLFTIHSHALISTKKSRSLA